MVSENCSLLTSMSYDCLATRGIQPPFLTSGPCQWTMREPLMEFKVPTRRVRAWYTRPQGGFLPLRGLGDKTSRSRRNATSAERVLAGDLGQPGDRVHAASAEDVLAVGQPGPCECL